MTSDIADLVARGDRQLRHFGAIGESIGRELLTALEAVAAERDEALLVLATPEAFHQHALRNPVLSRNNALHIAGATDYDHLNAEVERLRSALKPFAAFAENNVGADGWEGSGCQHDRIVDWFGPSEFRAALSLQQEDVPK